MFQILKQVNKKLIRKRNNLYFIVAKPIVRRNYVKPLFGNCRDCNDKRNRLCFENISTITPWNSIQVINAVIINVILINIKRVTQYSISIINKLWVVIEQRTSIITENTVVQILQTFFVLHHLPLIKHFTKLFRCRLQNGPRIADFSFTHCAPPERYDRTFKRLEGVNEAACVLCFIKIDRKIMENYRRLSQQNNPGYKRVYYLLPTYISNVIDRSSI